MTPTVAPPQPATRSRDARADLVLVGIEATLVAGAVVVGAVLNHPHVPIQRRLLRSTRWLPHLGPGIPLAVAVGVAVVWWEPRVAACVGWRRLL